MTQVKDGIVQTAMQTTLVWLLLPIAWNKTDTSFIMSDLCLSYLAEVAEVLFA